MHLSCPAGEGLFPSPTKPKGQPYQHTLKLNRKLYNRPEQGKITSNQRQIYSLCYKGFLSFCKEMFRTQGHSSAAMLGTERLLAHESPKENVLA